jgi:hypothetical protein
MFPILVWLFFVPVKIILAVETYMIGFFILNFAHLVKMDVRMFFLELVIWANNPL